ncbi:MAG: prepilin-type N-terminal cleavage/methylation domain-containing protein [Deltaproteobacteria bacterium]|nr:prepilin-type N-terminal cleavage/methylation domain-containing protein [Deltaproteobacteria bacterium]
MEMIMGPSTVGQPADEEMERRKHISPMSKAGRSGGFTLLEVLVAVGLAAAVLAALYATFFSVLRSRDAVDRALERSAEIRRFLDRFTGEAHSAFFSVNNPLTSFAGEENYKLGAPSSELSFTSFNYPAREGARPASDLVYIRYFVEKSDSGIYTLFRESANPFAAQKGGAFKVEAVEDIDGFEASFYNGKDWVKAWDSVLEGRPPEAVRAVVRIREGQDVSEFSAIARVKVR